MFFSSNIQKDFTAFYNNKFISNLPNITFFWRMLYSYKDITLLPFYLHQLYFIRTLNKKVGQTVQWINTNFISFHRFLKAFIQNAQRGTLARLNTFERSEEEQREFIFQSRTKIKNLQTQCEQVHSFKYYINWFSKWSY